MTDHQEQLLSDMRALLDHLRQGIQNQHGLNPDIEAGIKVCNCKTSSLLKTNTESCDILILGGFS